MFNKKSTPVRPEVQAAETALIAGLAMGDMLPFLKKAFRWSPEAITQFERNATPAQIAQLYRTVNRLKAVC